jgi:hypothetical protein
MPLLGTEHESIIAFLWFANSEELRWRLPLLRVAWDDTQQAEGCGQFAARGDFDRCANRLDPGNLGTLIIGCGANVTPIRRA